MWVLRRLELQGPAADLQGEVEPGEGYGRWVAVRGVALAGANQDQQVAAALRRRQVRLLWRPRLRENTLVLKRPA